MTAYLLDASALLAVLLNEPGEEMVAGIMETGSCYVSLINFSEAIFKLLRSGKHKKEDVLSALQELTFELYSPTEKDAVVAACDFVPQTRALNLSLGDRFCLAIAKNNHWIAVTADHSWKDIQEGPKVQLLRK